MSERKRSGNVIPVGKRCRSPYDVEAMMLATRMARKEEIPRRGRAPRVFRHPKPPSHCSGTLATVRKKRLIRAR